MNKEEFINKLYNYLINKYDDKPEEDLVRYFVSFEELNEFLNTEKEWNINE